MSESSGIVGRRILVLSLVFGLMAACASRPPVASSSPNRSSQAVKRVTEDGTADAAEQRREARRMAEDDALVRADPHPEHEARRAEVVAGINQVMRGEQGFGGVLEYRGHCRVQISVKGRANGPGALATLSLRSLDHARLTNVSWMDMDSVVNAGIGVLYFIEVIDKHDPHEGHLSLRTENAAQQVVLGFEELGQSCGAW